MSEKTVGCHWSGFLSASVRIRRLHQLVKFTHCRDSWLRLAYRYLMILQLAFCSTAFALSNETTLVMPWVEISGQRIYVEIAADNISQSRGLMYRKELAKDHGMLFVFPRESRQQFWMKNTLIPLDIIYLDSSMRVVNMALGAQPCKNDPCPNYPSDAPVRFVLEINAGMAKSLGLQQGDVIHFEMPSFQ